jgi:hypothetical protein
MNNLVLALPSRLLRAGRTLAGQLVKPAKRAATLLDRAVHRSGPAPAQVTPDPGPVAAPAPTRPAAQPAPPPEPEVVVDPVPLPEPAVDTDIEVTLPSELPIRSYDALSAADAAAAIKELTDAEEVRTILRFEEENAKRKTVLAAAASHLTTLGQQAATISVKQR